MAYRPRDIYRGRRKFRVPLTIFFSVLAVILIGGVVLFYALQQYIVYDAAGVTLQLPFMEDTSTAEETEATPEPTFEPITVEVIYEDTDFSQVDLGGWEELSSVQARFISFSDVTDTEDLASAVTDAENGGYSGVVLEMKDSSGQLAWASTSTTAVSYGTAGSTDVSAVIAELHEKDMTVAAQISCCADELLATRNWTVTLQTASGAAYQDENQTYWLDPYNRTVRTYLAELAQELGAMGFDEIILADLYHPIADDETGFTYSTTLQTDPNPVTAVCQMGRRIAEAMEGTGVAVSALLDADSLRNGQGSQTGQDVDIFWRLFARLYCPTDGEALSQDRENALGFMTQGDADVRFVAVCSSVPEDCASYLIQLIQY